MNNFTKWCGCAKGHIDDALTEKNEPGLYAREQIEKAIEYLQCALDECDTGNAGCDKCGMYDRIEGSKFCVHCQPGKESTDE